jgi:alkaline phosphatase D
MYRAARAWELLKYKDAGARLSPRLPGTTRRDALLGGISALAVAPACTWLGRSGASGGVFAHGVASGDPGPNSVVLWTRVNPAAGARSASWAVAEDSGFARTVAAGDVAIGPERDFTAKAVVEGLEPGATYYYRFSAGGSESPTGRTRTLPVGRVDSLSLAVASCSNFPFGRFNAYSAIADDPDVGFVLHLGDYIYEYAADSWGSDIGTALGRLHAPMHEIVSLADYRERHAQYKADPDSQRMHAAHPLIPVWDDHESTNNPWVGGAENHQPDTEGSWETRRNASIRAYYEWMPIREPSAPERAASRWSHFAFGDLASLITLETRHTGRSKQIDYSNHLDAITTRAAAASFRTEILGDPARHMLSQDMLTFLEQALADTGRANRPWKLLGNQIPIARVNVPAAAPSIIGEAPYGLTDAGADELSLISVLARFNLPMYLDTWDGYGAARENFYRRVRSAGVNDLLVLTGDSHAFWINELHSGDRQRMGYEIGTAGITSPGDFERYGPDPAIALDEAVTADNPEVLWTDNRHRGYAVVELSRDDAVVRFMTVSDVLETRFTVSELKRVRLSKDERGLAIHDA